MYCCLVRVTWYHSRMFGKFSINIILKLRLVHNVVFFRQWINLNKYTHRLTAYHTSYTYTALHRTYLVLVFKNYMYYVKLLTTISGSTNVGYSLLDECTGIFFPSFLLIYIYMNRSLTSRLCLL